MLNGESKIFKHRGANTLYMLIPSKVVSDSNFPFKGGDNVSIRIENNGLRVEKI